MKIIYITNSRIPTEKAHGFQVMKTCEAFSKAGVKVELWIPKRFNPIKESPFDYYGVRKIFEIKKIPVLDFMPLEKIFGRLANWIESLSFAILVKVYLAKSGNEDTMVYSRDPFSLIFLNRKYVFEIHSFPKNFRWYKKLWRSAYRLVAITQGLKNLLIKQGIKAEKIIVAPDGVDLEAFNVVNQSKEELKIELGLPAGDFLVGYVGKFKTLGMEKGIKTMIKALPLLDKDIKMVFVGG